MRFSQATATLLVAGLASAAPHHNKRADITDGKLAGLGTSLIPY